MALQLPTRTVNGARLALRFPHAGAAAEVRDLGGSRLGIRLARGGSLSGSVVEVESETLIAEVRPDGDTELRVTPRVSVTRGEALVVCWTELNDLASVDAVVEGAAPDGVSVRCEWPPERVQRRAFRRLVDEFPVWVVRPGRSSAFEGVTRDISGGGVSARVIGIRPEPGDRLVLVLRCDDRDFVLPSIVQWYRRAQAVMGLRFEKISQRDQDHLVRYVTTVETSRAG